VSVCLSVTSRSSIETDERIALIFLAQRLPWTYPTLCFKKILIKLACRWMLREFIQCDELVTVVIGRTIFDNSRRSVQGEVVLQGQSSGQSFRGSRCTLVLECPNFLKTQRTIGQISHLMSHISKTTLPNFIKFSVFVARVCGLVFLWAL